MNHFKYRVFYEWSGPSLTNHLRNELTEDEILDAFQLLQSEIVHRLGDQDEFEPPRVPWRLFGLSQAATATA